MPRELQSGQRLIQGNNKMEFGLSSKQKLLSETVRRFVEQQVPLDRSQIAAERSGSDQASGRARRPRRVRHHRARGACGVISFF